MPNRSIVLKATSVIPLNASFVNYTDERGQVFVKANQDFFDQREARKLNFYDVLFKWFKTFPFTFSFLLKKP